MTPKANIFRVGDYVQYVKDRDGVLRRIEEGLPGYAEYWRLAGGINAHWSELHLANRHVTYATTPEDKHTYKDPHVVPLSPEEMIE